MTKLNPDPIIRPYLAPAGGRGAALRSLAAFREQNLTHMIVDAFRRNNKPRHHDCGNCAWGDRLDKFINSCEQGAKWMARMLSKKAATAAVFAQHTITSMREWSDQDLEDLGRLTEPMRYNRETDRYEAVTWDYVFWQISEIGMVLDPESVAFYTSGRSVIETAFLWQLAARTYGSANLPDSSNFCHEPSGTALREQIGVGKGTCKISDFEHAELIIVCGQNPASNHPRMMGELYDAANRGATVIAINPIVEHGFINFSDPQNPWEMLTNSGKPVMSEVYQVKSGGDLALFKGVMKYLIECEDQGDGVIDHEFVQEHCNGYEQLATDLRATSWADVVTKSGLSEAKVREIGDLYAQSQATMVTWCMGITHHEDSVATIQTMVNLLLLKGNIGRDGTGAFPVRGHSNVQGDRTVGATHKVPERWLDNMEEYFPGIVLNRKVGLDAMGVIDGLFTREIKGFFGLGGNFGVAAPDSERVLNALSQTKITVHIATHFNRTHVYPGEIGLVLPCLGRTEVDIQNNVEQITSVEDTVARLHGSQGHHKPLSPLMMSEPAICAQIGHALVGERYVNWRAFHGNYDRIRTAIEACQKGVYDGFDRFNDIVRSEKGIHLPNSAAMRVWKTASERAELISHPIRFDGPIERAVAKFGDKVLSLMTKRSHNQFNTTVLKSDDEYHGIYGSRFVVFANCADIARLGFRQRDYVDIETCSEDGIERVARGYMLVEYQIAEGCIAGYFPELTKLVPAGLVSRRTKTPAYKEVPVILSPALVAAPGGVLDPSSTLPASDR